MAAAACPFGFSPELIGRFATKGASSAAALQAHFSDAASSNDNFPTKSFPFSSFTEGHGDHAGGDHAGGDDKAKAEPEAHHSEGGGPLAKLDDLFNCACFPADASVYLKGRGPCPVDQVKAGDWLLCGNAEDSTLFFSPFLGHLHAEQARRTEFIAVQTSGTDKTLRLSRTHLLFRSSGQDGAAVAVRASALNKGDWLCRVGCDGALERVQITKILRVVENQGYFAPLTEAGTVVVNGILCSCYVDALPKKAPAWLRKMTATHGAMHNTLFPLRLAARLGLDYLFDFDKDAMEGKFHPLVRPMMALPAAAKVFA